MILQGRNVYKEPLPPTNDEKDQIEFIKDVHQDLKRRNAELNFKEKNHKQKQYDMQKKAE